MPFFIKTETFTPSTRAFSVQQRRLHLDDHRAWVEALRSSGCRIASGYLVDEHQRPGGGGWLVLEAESFQQAKSLVEKDPMISRGLVDWTLSEWRSVCGDLLG